MAKRISQLPLLSPGDISPDDILPITDFESDTTYRVAVQDLQEYFQLVAGYTGSVGNIGFTGSVGLQGVRGFSGSVGQQGAAGLQGLSGAQGPQGYTGSAGVIQSWSLILANYNAQDKQRLIADTSAGTFTVTLPSAPALGTYIIITDGADFSLNNLLIARNGSTIENIADDLLLDIKNVTYEFIYTGTTWQVTATVGVQGYTGSTGAQGPQGPAGFQGLQGVAGPQGPQGPLGYTGSAGVVSTTVLRPSLLTGGSTYDNYSPLGIASAKILLLSRSGAGVITLTGIDSTSRTDGDVLKIYHEDAGTEILRLANESLSSTAANRILAPKSLDYDIDSRSGVELFYDASVSRWRLLAG